MISAVVITRNEERNIGECVQALLQVTDDVLILDSGSEDNTRSIAKNLGARVIPIEWIGYGKSKNLAIEHIKYPWILSIDADEVLSKELIQEIRKLTLQEGKIYAINILTNYCGSWIKYSGWYPSYKKRLYQASQVKWDEREVHENLTWSNRHEIHRLKNVILHYSYRTKEDHVRKGQHYAKLGAEHLIKSKKQVSIFKQLFGPAYRFFRMFLLKRGLLDGKAGFLLAIREARMVSWRYQYYRKMKTEK